MKLTVLIPVFNEINTIAETLRRVWNVRFPKEVIVIDDGSTDGSREFLAQLKTAADPGEDYLNDLKVILKPSNQGKGAAIRSALPHITGNIVIIQDADLEYSPDDYLRLLDPILTGKADVVYGTRFYGSQAHRVLYFWHYIGNQMVTFFANMLTTLNLSDMEVGYKVFRSRVLKNINIRSKRFGFEPEITMKVAKKKCRIYEVPISYHGRTYEEGKKITWKDGIAAFYFLVRFRLTD